VDGAAAFFGEAADHSTGGYFQSLRKFHERGAPTALPAARERALENDQRMVELRMRVDTAEDSSSEREATNALCAMRYGLRTKELECYQREWLEERRKWKILTRGKVAPNMDTEPDDIIDFITERQRVAKLMANQTRLPRSEMKGVVQDLYVLASRDFRVCYLPGEGPDEQGNCRFCGTSMQE
jgi:hypothetical protein